METEVRFTEEDRGLLMRLTHAVFGIDGDPESGLLREMRELNHKLDRLVTWVATAAISFGAGSISVAVALIVGNH